MCRLTLLVLPLFLAAAGCRAPEPAVMAAGGKVVLRQRDGTLVPMGGAKLVLAPAAGADAARAFPSTRAGPDGAFQLGTAGTDDGAAEGEYVVTVEWRERYEPAKDVAGRGARDRGPDRLGGWYADRATSPLRATVAAVRHTRPSVNGRLGAHHRASSWRAVGYVPFGACGPLGPGADCEYRLAGTSRPLTSPPPPAVTG